MGIVVRGARVVDGVDGERQVDARFGDGASTEVETSLAVGTERIVDGDGLLLMPGLIDAHSHADNRILDDEVQYAY